MLLPSHFALLYRDKLDKSIMLWISTLDGEEEVVKEAFARQDIIDHWSQTPEDECFLWHCRE